MVKIARYFLATTAALFALYMEPSCDSIFTAGIAPHENYSVHVCAIVAAIALRRYFSQIGFRFASALSSGKFIIYALGTMLVFQDKALSGGFPVESAESLLGFRWQLEAQWLEYTGAQESSFAFLNVSIARLFTEMRATSLLNGIWVKAHPGCIAHAEFGANLGRYALALVALLGAVGAFRPIFTAKPKRE